MLHGIIDRAKGDEDAIRKELSTWFGNAMDRVSGKYKRWAQLFSFIFAFAIAALLNISAIDVATSLWNHPVDTTALATIKDGDLKGLFTNLDMLHQKTALPIGWPAADSSQCWTLFFGWLITALASLFGAPFWFDALQQFVRLKGSGPSPGEKATNTAAANGKAPAAATPA
jgi:TRAP-type C4-dicarboxylate transport system permease small subunit